MTRFTNSQYWSRNMTKDIGYVRIKTPMLAARAFENLAKGFVKTNSTIRIWHTKHLFIVWESEPRP